MYKSYISAPDDTTNPLCHIIYTTYSMLHTRESYVPRYRQFFATFSIKLFYSLCSTTVPN